MSAEAKIYVLCHFAAKSSLYQPWIDAIEAPVEIVNSPLHDWEIPNDAGLLVTHLHYQWESLSALRRAMERRSVPVLILADGVLEYRNTWEHPSLPDGCMFQPLFGHKLACIGRGQARQLESWGNPPGTCEVVGLPRLDNIKPLPSRSSDDRFRVLVASANTASFTQSQHQQVVDSMNALKSWASERQILGRKLELVWRLNEPLSAELGTTYQGPSDRPPLAVALEQTDAVVTTPSTLMLESALYGRPTAVLDFTNSPPYVPSAWTISHPDHFDSVMNDLADPPPGKRQFQRFTLDQNLEHLTPAKPRMLRLLETMFSAGQVAQVSGKLELPQRIVPLEPQSDDPLPSLTEHFPDNEAFAERELQRLQIELSAARVRLGQLPTELAHREGKIAEVVAKNEHLNLRVKELHARVKKLRQRLGIEGPAGISAAGEQTDSGEATD